MDIIDQMKAAETMTRQLVAELRAAGVHPCAIGPTLYAAAGHLWQEAFPDEETRRKVMLHAAEVGIAGRPQPID